MPKSQNSPFFLNFSEPNSQCHYLIRKAEGQISLYDHRRTGVRKFEDCQKLCAAEYGFQCRSFTFDEKEGVCYLNHHGAMMIKAFLGPQFVQSDENLSFGDVEDCVESMFSKFWEYV